ncbi:hypothetical protein ACQ4WY_27630 [Janthinobacterium sp. LB2P49]|uniref:hypothetical protein n=1 Tax=Janthinobacterium sp. LB2P49 TaxID=3424198 RepID=UPI003F213D22
MTAAPPLRVILSGVALAAGFIALLALYRHLPGDRRDNTVAGQALRFLAAPADVGKLRVIALGSSLLWAATPQPANLQRASMQDIDWLRMTKGGAGLGPLQESLEVIERHRPDVLLLDENMLLPDTGNVLMDPLREETWHFAKKTVAFLSAGKLTSPIASDWERNDQERHFSCASNLVRLTEAQKHKHAVELQDMYRRAAFDTGLIARLSSLARSGVRIVLLDIRRSAAMEQETAQQKQQWRTHLQTILAGDNIVYLISPGYPQQSLYCDGSHLNAAGARLFGPWLHAQLQRLRKER